MAAARAPVKVVEGMAANNVAAEGASHPQVEKREKQKMAVSDHYSLPFLFLRFHCQYLLFATPENDRLGI